MKRVYKYEITIEEIDKGSIELPRGAEPLSVTSKDNYIFMYCLVDPDEIKKDTYKIVFVGTGWDIEEEQIKNFKFLGTVNQCEVYFWHIWIENKEVKNQG